MTIACAAAANFWQLAPARAGVGSGEAACTPCAHSMICDSFPAGHRRPRFHDPDRRLNWRHAATVVIGCFILFGATDIVAGIRQSAQGSGV